MTLVDIQTIRSRAERGDSEAQVELGFLYARGSGVGRDVNKGIEWFHRAAEQGNADAQSVLGTIFHEGLWGVPVNYQKAIEWHRLAAAQGWVPSLLDLGLMYDNGRGVSKDGEKAFEYFRLALSEGRGGGSAAHTEALEKLMAMFLVRIAEACSGSHQYSYLATYEERKALACEIGMLLYRIGGMRAMKRALDEHVGRIPGQRTIDQFWDGIGDWRG